MSGGTLVPQRLARGLRERGHVVSVFAGWLGDAAPLSTWDEEDLTGLPVRWVAIAPWIGWSDEHNFSNPPVEEIFAQYLADVRPDVVHLHALQSMGAGLAHVARNAGCAVVVTMHDFWWICARQFLVDRQYQPCSLVIDAGTCQCEVDRPWLEARTTRLRGALRGVDLVLAPSQSAVDVLRANGVAGGRVEVDENGLPSELVATLSAGSIASVDRHGSSRTFVYAGGADRMKGWQVLLDAVTQLATDGATGTTEAGPGLDWRLVAYGVDPATIPVGVAVDARPAFTEDTLAAVLAEADAVVLPSVMRETFSLLTREALCRGVPVVATDTLGPEEVVRDGRNGLIVPAADPSALADALRRVLDEPGLLDRLRAGCREPIPLRSVDDQVEALERRYQEVLEARAAAAHDTAALPAARAAALPAARAARAASPAAPAAPAARSAPAGAIERVVFAVGIDGAPLRYRGHLPAEALRLVGVSSEVRNYRDPELPERLRHADAAVFYRVPATHQVLDLIGSAHDRAIPVVFDVDDLIFDPEIASEIPALEILPPAEAELWMEGVRRYRTTMECSDLFVGSTIPLCEHAAAVTGLPARRFANGVGLVLARRSEAARAQLRSPGPPRMGYFSGTTTHDQDWALIEPSVRQVLDQRPDVELWLGGHVKASEELATYGNRIRVLPMMPWTELPTVLRAVDINLAPLVVESRFNQAKSAIKWLEAALVDTPTIASPTQPFQEVITDGETGRIAGSQDEWAAAIDELLGDPRAGAAMARRARRQALLTLSPHLQGQRYLAILEEAAALCRERGPRQSSGWSPVANDEPSMSIPLMAYDESRVAVTPSSEPAQGPAWRLDRDRALRVLRRTWTSLNERGVRTTMQRAAVVGRRHLSVAFRQLSARARAGTGRRRTR